MSDLHITLKTKVSMDHFEEIIVTALEGGSNYWYEINADEFKDELEGENGEPLSTRIAQSLYNNPDFKMKVYDVEEGDLLGTVTQSSMLKAIGTAHQDYSQVYHDLMEGQGDADTADVLFQLAVMNEIVFG